MDKLASQGAKRRRRSADSRKIQEEVRRLEGDLHESNDEVKHVKVEPLIDPFTGARMFHIASHNLYDAAILTRNVEAGFTWFMHVQRAIYKSYASLASAIQ